MTVTLTYDDTLSRVQLTADGLGTADVAVVERSINQVTWTTVRGGSNLTPLASSISIDDYEFSPNVPNYYRVTYIDVAEFVVTGAAAHANNASVTPTMPAGVQAGDELFLYTAIRSSGTGTPNTPTGYSLILDMSNARLFGRVATGAGEVAPTVSFTGGAADDSTSAQMSLFRHIESSALVVGSRLNASTQNISTPAVTYTSTTSILAIYLGWKQDDWTSVTAVTDGTLIDAPSTILGSDQGLVWAYRVVSTATTALGARTFVVTGGAAAISRGGIAVFAAAEQTQTGSITPTITNVWLKSPARPFLNRELECINEISEITRDARNGIFDIIARSVPVAVTDYRKSRAVTIRFITQTTTQREEFDLILSTGDVMYLQAPPTHELPTMYVVIDQTEMRKPLRRNTCNNDWRVFTLPLREVAAPGPHIVGSTGTWQTVINTYATWSDVIAAHTTWADVLTLVGTPSEVITP